MKRRELGSFLSAAAVALSLVFVGSEIRQNTAAVRGATMQAISDASTEFMVAMSLDADFAEMSNRVFEGSTQQDFTPKENFQLETNLTAFLRMLENTYLQHREGLVSDAVFESYGWNGKMIRTAYFKEFWDLSARLVVSEEFQRFFQSRVHIGP